MVQTKRRHFESFGMNKSVLTMGVITSSSGEVEALCVVAHAAQFPKNPRTQEVSP
jgi:hypothetical protein